MKSTLGRQLTGLVCALALIAGAVPALAAAGPGSAGGSKGKALPKAPALEGGLKVKPTSMQIIAVSHNLGETKFPTIIGGKASGNHSTPLHWTKWNATEAVVDAYVYDGTPDGYPSTITLSHPRSVDGQFVFTQLKGRGDQELRAKIYHQPGAGDALEWAPPGTR